MLDSKITEDIIMGGNAKHMKKLAENIRKKCDVSKVIIDG